jgi:prepilin peptidase CpaA
MNQGILIAVYVLLAGAAIQDVASLRISNLFPIVLIALFGLWLYANGVPDSIWKNGLMFLLILAIGIGMFALRWLGGGDVKLLAAGALWFDFQGGISMFVYMCLCGGLLSLFLIFARRMIPAPVRDRLGWPGLKPRGPIPYGIAISVGIVLALLSTGPNPSGRPKLIDLHLSGFPTAPQK